MNKMRIWWIPQLGMKKTFYVQVDTLLEGKRLLDVLANYDLFQLRNNVKPDYCNAGGLQVYSPYTDPDDPTNSWEWEDWCNEEGDSIEELSEEQVKKIDIERKNNEIN